MAKSVSDRLDAARERTRDRGHEVMLLLAVLTRERRWRARSHLAPAVDPRADDTWRWAVCIHINGEALAWRISDEHAITYFAHLGTARTCEHDAPTRDEKMERLDRLALPK